MSGFLCAMVGASFTVAAAAEVIRRKKGITAVGNAQVDTAQSKYGGAAALFDGTGDYLIVGNAVDSDMALTSTTWTVEYWARISAHAGQYQATVAIWNDVDATGAVYYFSTNAYSTTNKMGFEYIYDTNTSSGALNFGSALSTGVWQHHAFVRNGNTLTAYLDGVSQGTHDMTGRTIDITGFFSSSNTTMKMTIGAMTGGGGAYNGWLDEIRVSNTARYTTTFTPSTTPFVNDANTVLLIHANGTDASTFFDDDNGTGRSAKAITAIGNAQVDTAQSKFGGASLLMDGNGDRLNVTGEVLPAQYTVEYWFRLASFTSAPTFVDFRGGGAHNYSDFITTGGVFTVYINSSPIVTSALSTNTWYHIAVVRDSSSDIKLYLNGTKTGVTLNDANYSSNTSWYIGDNYVFANSVNGHMDEIRVSNTARYTANFSVATAPFVNDANTVLLLHCDGTDGSTVFSDDNGALGSNWTGRRQVPLTIGGNMQISTAESKFGSSSLLSDGVGDYIIADTNVAFGTGAFTIEWWCYMTTATDEYIFDCRGSGVELLFIRYSSGRYQFNIGADIGWLSNSGVTIGTNTWIHFALVRQSNGDVKIYRDGVDHNSSGVNQINSGIMNDNTNLASTDFWISANASTLGTNWYGYIDEFRVSNTARYTTTFTPASTAFGNDANTVLLIHGDGANASTTITDDIGTGRTQKGIQALGNAQVDTAQSKFGGASLLLDGTGDYLELAPVGIGLARTDNFTCEAWIRLAALPASGSFLMFLNGTAGGGEQYMSIKNISGTYVSDIVVSNGTTAREEDYTISSISTNTWYHWAIVKNGSTLTHYFNGIALTTLLNSSGTMTSGHGFETLNKIGVYVNNTLGWNGHLDEIRISNSVRYTANFTPSTTPFQNDANTLLLIHADGSDASTAFFDDNGIAPYTP